MENICIKVLNNEHGKKVVEYFKSLGVDTKDYIGDNINGYYGIFDNDNVFTCRNHPYSSKVITLPTEKTLPRKMLTWDIDKQHAKERLVIWINPDKTATIQCSAVSEIDENSFYNGNYFNVDSWRHCEELPKVEELTLEQICKELGRTIKIIK